MKSFVSFTGPVEAKICFRVPSPVFGFGILVYWRSPEGQPGVYSLIYVPCSSEFFLLTIKVDISCETPAIEFLEPNSGS